MIKRKCVLLTLEMQSDPSSGGTDDAGRTGLVGALEDHGPWSAMLSRPQHSSSVRDLRVPNEWQEQRNVEPFRRGVERWPLVSLLFPWVCP